MPIIRKKFHTENFVVLDKHFLEDKTISFKAKGLLTLLISRPDAWKVSARELASASMDGKDSVYAGLKELEEAGYIEYEKVQDLEGKFLGGEYYVYECKSPIPGQSAALAETPHPEKPYRENPTLVNNKLVNIKITKQEQEESIVQNAEGNHAAESLFSVPVLSMDSEKETTISLVHSENSHDQSCSSHLGSSEIDHTLGEVLTVNQERVLENEILQWQQNVVITNPDFFKEEVRFSLLNPRHFFHAGTDFKKKLNTIGKMVREKRWRTPHGFKGAGHVSNESSFQDRTLFLKIREMEIELHSHRQSLEGPLAQNAAFKASQLATIASLELSLSQLRNHSSQQKDSLFFTHSCPLSTRQEEKYDRYKQTA